MSQPETNCRQGNARAHYFVALLAVLAVVFETGKPDEDKALFRLANFLHINTRASTIRDQLLFTSGDVYSRRLLDESERLLRENRYFYDARIDPVRYCNGIVDVTVRTRDVWTLNVGASGSRQAARTKPISSSRN